MNICTLSPCRKYRYLLMRSCLPANVFKKQKSCLFIMLNPSTADAVKDDATIRRCTAFAKREGATFLTVVNLFALRATNPKELYTVDDPVGPLNNQYLKDQINAHKGHLIIAAWGTQRIATSRVSELISMGILRDGMKCFGKTQRGYPRHPLFLRGDVDLVDYKIKDPLGG